MSLYRHLSRLETTAKFGGNVEFQQVFIMSSALLETQPHPGPLLTTAITTLHCTPVNWKHFTKGAKYCTREPLYGSSSFCSIIWRRNTIQ